MSEITCDVTISLDGFVAGANPTRENPLGDGGEQLHRWQFEEAADNRRELELLLGAGAFIMGRNMFGPEPGNHEKSWRGWWGEEPPYHAEVFVLTHHERPAERMSGGTIFNFVTGGVKEAIASAGKAAGDQNIAIAGGARTINQFLQADLIDELRLHIAPLTLGAGVRLFENVGSLNLQAAGVRQTPLVTHVTYRRSMSKVSEVASPIRQQPKGAA